MQAGGGGGGNSNVGKLLKGRVTLWLILFLGFAAFCGPALRSKKGKALHLDLGLEEEENGGVWDNDPDVDEMEVWMDETGGGSVYAKKEAPEETTANKNLLDKEGNLTGVGESKFLRTSSNFFGLFDSGFGLYFGVVDLGFLFLTIQTI